MSDLKSYRTPQLEGGQRVGSDAIFNSNCQHDILVALADWKCTRVLLVHSRALAAQTPHITNLKTALGPLLVDSKSGVGSHSPYADVIDIGHRISTHAIDAIVCVGSGSYSDACKSARILAATLPAGFGEEEMEALIDPAIGINHSERMQKSAAKLILVPCSLSAGEWTNAASATNSVGKKQHFTREDGCAADLILSDPHIARTAPRELWLSSGIRAVDHCCELLCHERNKVHPDAQEWCLTGLRALAKGLVEYHDGIERGDALGEEELIRGISKCQIGSRWSLMSLLVYDVPIGPSHAIGHQLGSVGGIMHGKTSCIILPHVLRYTKSKNPDAQARIVGVFNEALGWNETDAGDCVARLVKTIEMPGSLQDVGGLRPDQIEKVIDGTMTDAVNHWGKVMEREQISDIVYSAR